MSANPATSHNNAPILGRKQRPWYSRVNWIAVVAAIFVLLLILRVIQVQMDLAAAGKSYPPAYWAFQISNGLVLGGVYALIALGYTLVYGILMMINFAHGEIVMFGAYAGFFVLAACDATGFTKTNQVATLLLVFGAGMLVSMLMGIGLERIAYRPLRAAPRLVPLITAIGASVFLQETSRLIFGAPIRVYNKPAMLQGAITLPGNVAVPITGAFIIVASIIMMVVLYWLVQHTRTGRAMRAVATNKEAAALMGISVDRIIVITFAIGSILAGAAGVMLGFHNSQINSTMGFFPGIKAFTAAVLGGIGNIPGAMLGGFILGLSEALGPSLLGIPSQYKDVIAFTLLVLVLIFRPQGILGEQLGAEKA
ncbi:MAG: High-affinity branched-chain amino acid transport system permease protein LivH [Anaerolineae bacterium]|nr:High-affinity branched-chain amino acid transport system permease protein LivH [Anaerolineae bacterium]